MGYDCFDVTFDDKVAHIVLNRPEKRNSMNPAFWVELPEIVHDIDDNARARVIVISSTGPHFSAGLDLSAFGPPPAAGGAAGAEPTEQDKRDARRTRGAGFYENVRRMQESFSCLESCRVPVLAAIQGGAIGGGVDLATACDMRYATEDAFLTIQETNIGMTADVGTFPRLVKLIPEGIVRELAYTGRRMPAREAEAVGLVNRVFPDQQAMLAGVMEIAREIASKAPLAVYGCKRMINYARDHSTADGLDYIGIWNASMLQPDEIVEAMTSNREKRAGDFAELPRVRPRKDGDGF
ncbi:MAG: crotonase/enoyl-CoA hydratase family protein [Deltaproteobacteria bacterium]|nr:crotonase/enoyl-CoA hydratase family protein [Deltaproteobacteria bacterium]MBW2416423.1 crotonase/enoyl-CoA hydratase family protein [Deltaproteobacteria bacterium]